MNIITTCEHCKFSQIRPNNKLKDKAYKYMKAKPINYWICTKCGEDNFNGIKSIYKLN